MNKNELLRKAIVNRITEVTEKHDALIYGSFSNNTFHLQSKDWYSLSDLDLKVKSCFEEDRQNLVSIIGQEVVKATGLHIPISVRTEIIHDRRLTVNQYWIIAAVEFFYKTAVNMTKVNFGYQYAKMLLRTLGNYPYFYCPFCINEYNATDLKAQLANKCLEIKIGFRKPEEGLSLFLEKNVLKMNIFLQTMKTKFSTKPKNKIFDFITSEFSDRPELILDIQRKLSIGIQNIQTNGIGY